MRKALRLQNALEPSANFEDEPGAEAFYSYTVTPSVIAAKLLKLPNSLLHPWRNSVGLGGY